MLSSLLPLLTIVSSFVTEYSFHISSVGGLLFFTTLFLSNTTTWSSSINTNNNNNRKGTTFLAFTKSSAAFVTSEGGGLDDTSISISSRSSISSISTEDDTATTKFENWRTISSQSIEGEKDTLFSLESSESWSNYEESLALYHAFMDCQDSFVGEKMRDALRHLHDALRLYGPRSVLCSYNGGKDAVVVLHLLRAALANYYSSNAQCIQYRPRMIYFDNKDEFPEIRSLLHETVHDFDLEMIAFDRDIDYVTGLTLLVDSSNLNLDNDRKMPLSFVLGTRSDDPNAKDQGHFAPSSWGPPFMRVNPVLDWTYGHVWHFLRLYPQLPYCTLYDQGYTSLGTTKDTQPCPALFDSNQQKYLPAYTLQDWDQERAGRTNKKKIEKSDKEKITTEKKEIVVEIPST
eukprot:CAMPEP_0194144750 /NCGR_PEP_ID=MMETSP0152-20130528/13764_1 /TAXON_ID=1049557 /ORGANISM="Thalassiothrix antarctica, Strain L6-D1" /LENGTH=402 /DNA_ID=CAMNT_0038844723 /DNA_START=74 /DNA_END=1279 /DNA_ORIENTATION=+